MCARVYPHPRQGGGGIINVRPNPKPRIVFLIIFNMGGVNGFGFILYLCSAERCEDGANNHQKPN